MSTRTTHPHALDCLRRITRPFLLLPFVLFPVAAQTAKVEVKGQPDWSQVRKIIQQRMAAESIPSVSIAVVRNGKILWEEGFGWADRENRIPANEHTMYYTASITKTFTDTAIMLLQQRKQLELDRPLNDYLGSAKLSSPAWNPAGATVRRVMTHTAGLTTFNPVRPLSMDELISRYGVLFWPPGEGFDYSNAGGIILQEVVARVSGQSYESFLRNEIFWPLGMTHTSMAVGPGLESYEAKAYNPVTGLRPRRTGGVYSSAHDLALFGMFHLKAHLPEQKVILPDDAIDLMQNSTVPTSFGKYGFSWTVEDDRFGYRSVLSQGGTDAAQAWLRLIPSEKIAVIVLSNSGSGSFAYIVDEILSTLLPKYGEVRAKAVAAPQNAPANIAPQGPAPAFIGNWSGIIKTYRGDLPLTLSINAAGDVHIKLGTQLNTLLNDVRFRPQRLSGRFAGDLGLDDIGVTGYSLHLSLNLRDGALLGAAETEASARLAFWTELKKVPATNGEQ
jgi:CubicO group peptidase (beta-lactamase class C family)